MTNSTMTDSTSKALANVSRELDTLIQSIRSEIANVSEPKAQALFETTAEVLIGLKKAYTDYKGGSEQAWQ
ncbi:MAG: hypothetical protein ABIQ44_14405 [Chloroflexia bacterium]